VWFYIRGEEYCAQLEYFVRCIEEKRSENVNSFESATVTDKVIAMMIADAEKGAATTIDGTPSEGPKRKKRFLFG